MEVAGASINADALPAPLRQMLTGVQCRTETVRHIGLALQPHALGRQPLGQLCANGGRNAVAEIGGIDASGFFAWFLWRALYLFKLPSWSRRVKVGADWLRPDPCHPSIESPPAFLFRRSASVRARTAVEVTTLGAQVFSRVSKSLAPLQQRQAQAIRIPEAYSVLSSQPLARVLEPAPRTVRRDATLEEVLDMFATHHADTLYVVDDDRRIEGVMTRTDLMRGVDVISTMPVRERNTASVHHFMSRDPMVLTFNDSPATAALMMRDRGLKNLPVVTNAEGRQVVGCVRMETMMHIVLQELALVAQAAQ
jgi:CBS domain-containing protein